MKTQDVIEGLLYISNYREALIDCLTACHVLNTYDRNWQPEQKTTFYFLDSFKQPSFLMIVDKQVHVFIIGEKVKGKSYAILNIEGFNTELLTMSKNELIKYIKEINKEVNDYFLPDAFNERIVFLKPDYISDNIDTYVFNKEVSNNKLFSKSNWSLGTNFYNINTQTYKTGANEILKTIMKDI